MWLKLTRIDGQSIRVNMNAVLSYIKEPKGTCLIWSTRVEFFIETVEEIDAALEEHDLNGPVSCNSKYTGVYAEGEETI